MTQNYGSAFYSCAAGMAVSAGFLALVKPAKKGWLCRCRGCKRPDAKPDDRALQNGARSSDKTRDGPPDCVELDVASDRKRNGAAGNGEEVI